MLRYFMTIVMLSIFIYTHPLKEIVQKDSFLSQGQTSFIQNENKTYLVSVGVSTIKDKSIISRVNAIKAARVLAQRGLTKFIHSVTLSSEEKLTIITTTVKEGSKIERKHNEKLIEIIREQSDGILHNVIEIGKWYKDGTYYYALGVLVPY